MTSFRLQAGGCKLFGSPLYQRLCEQAIGDLEREGPIYRLLAGWEGDPLRGFVALRLLGAVHEQVLAGKAPALARHYPSVGGSPEWPGVWEAFRDVVEEMPRVLERRLGTVPQTNEVRRCAGLLGGFLEAAARTGLPLRIREIGCSAGLNLQWDRFRYHLDEHRWGDPQSPVLLEAEWSGAPAPFDAPVSVASRAGCDVDPLRIEDPEQARLLEAYVWPDQTDRLVPLRAAIELARRDPPRVERASAGDWLAGELADVSEGQCSVVYHSSMWMYLGAEEQQRVQRLIEARGARATPSTPLGWLRHEDGAKPASVEVRLTLWPGGEERHLAYGHPHGRRVEWLV